jgi:3-(3-hydroxy-phenyl)propionate hydroxylase
VTPDRAPDTDHVRDVAIVGFGPAGSTLAGLLALRGVDVVVIDQDTDIHPLPRAVHFDQEIMRVLQELGIADELMPDLVVNPGMDFLTADRQVLLSMRPDGTTPSGWPASLFFFQPHLEHRLRNRAMEVGSHAELGSPVTALVDRGDHVTLALANGRVIAARYAIGCDGARSTVRRALGVGMDDLRFEEPWLVLDLVLHDGATPPAPLTYQVCDPARPTTLVPMPPPRFRFEFMLVDGDDPSTIGSSDSVRHMLSAWMDPDDADVERAAVYTFHGLVAHEWRRGRVLLAGDAAHQMPPFLGQGMCAGVRDAANLAWKLSRVVHGGAGEALLDTYQQERAPHVRQIVESAVNFGRLICTTDPEVAAARDNDMLAARASGGGAVGTAAMPALPAGALVVEGGGPQIPQVSFDGQRFDDVVGDRFAVVVRTAALIDDAARGWQALGAAVLVAEEHPGLSELLARVGTDTAVARPDRYLYASGPSVSPPLPSGLWSIP